MALSWGKDTSGVKKGSSAMPSKTSMNLYQPIDRGNPVTAAIAAVILAVLIGLFAKFGVIDQLARVSEAQGRLATAQAELSMYEAQLTDYDAVAAEYESYTSQLNSSDVSANDVLDLIEDYVMVYATVTSTNLQENVLALSLRDVPLDMVGTIAQGVKTHPLVKSVSVSTASTEENVDTVTAQMTIILYTTADLMGEADQVDDSSSLFAGLDTEGHSLLPPTLILSATSGAVA